MRKLSGKLKISHKLLLSSIVFAIPIGVLLYFVIEGYNRHIDFAEKEIRGAEIIDEASVVLENIACYAISQHRHDIISGGEYGNSEYEKQIHSSLSTIGHFMENEEDNRSITREALNNNGLRDINPEDILRRWKKFLDDKNNMTAAEKYAGFREFADDIHTFIRYIGDESNLILDPDLDSYYMMEISLIIMPELTISAMDFTYDLQLVSRVDSVDHQLAGELDYYITAIKKDYFERIDNAIEVASRKDAEYYGRSENLQKDIPRLFGSFRSSMNDYISMASAGNSPQTAAIAGAACKAIDEGIDFREKVNAELKNLLQRRADYYRDKKYTVLAISLGALLFAIVIILLISYSISRKLKSVTRIAGEIAVGNIPGALDALAKCKSRGVNPLLDSRDAVNIRDEAVLLLQEINIMTHNLDGLLSQVRQTGIQITSSATEISASSRQLESSVAEQAASTNQMNSTSKEITANSADLSDTMKLLLDQASEASRVAQNGVKALEGLNSTIHDLIDSSEEISEKLGFISEGARDIGEVITTITKVANQTNLLSLNAAIEAEKAGEAGVGFAVVAREIRRLADQTSVATLDIEDMVGSMSAAIEEGARAVEKNSRQRDISQETIDNISREFSMIIEQTREIEPRFESVSEGMSAQTQSAVTISEAMQQLNDSARQTKEAVEEFHRVTVALRESSGRLQKELDKFSISKK